jgi:cytochrome c biogenesis protein
VVELGGLARTEAAGYGEEFDRIVADLLPPETVRPPVAAGTSGKSETSREGR